MEVVFRDKAAGRLGGGAVFWIAETPKDVSGFLPTYLHDAVSSADKVFLLGSRPFFETVLDPVVSSQPDWFGPAQGQVEMVSIAGEDSVETALLTFPGLCDFLRKAIARAAREGYSRVRAIVDASAILDGVTDVSHFYAYVSDLDVLLGASCSEAVLITGRASIKPQILTALLITRQQVGIRDRLYQNPFQASIPPKLSELDLSGWLVHWFVELGSYRVEEDLQKWILLIRQAVEEVPFGVWVADSKGRIIYGNPTGKKVWGISLDGPMDPPLDLKGRFVDSGQLVPSNAWALDRAIQKGEATVNEMLEIETPDGHWKTILNSAIPVFDDEHHVVGAVAINEDITERRQIERDLVEVQHQLLVNAENERLKLAQDLHDGPIQDLYGVTFQVHELQEALQQSDLVDSVKTIQETLQQVISVLRVTCSEMRPPTLAPFGLEKAIRSHLESIHRRNPGLEIQVNLMPDGKLLPENIRMGFFRIYQELMNNIVRHAGATQVKVSFKLEDDCAILEVEDNGCGFEIPRRWVELVRQGHLGLVGLQERAEALGGWVKIRSTNGKGTQVRVVIPRNAGGENYQTAGSET